MNRPTFGNAILALAAPLLLTGCVGLQTHTQQNKTSPATDSYRLDGTPQLWSQSEHPVDGSVTLKSERQWCGAVLWAIVPLPLMLPVCKRYERVNFANGQPNMREEGWVDLSSFHGCGPGVWLGTGIMNGRTASFCATD